MAIAVVPDAPLSALPGVPDADDLPDTVTAPPGATAPLPARSLDEVYDALHALGRILDSAFDKLPPLFAKHEQAFQGLLDVHNGSLSASEASVLHDLCAALDRIQAQGLTVITSPYTAEVQAFSPQGFFVKMAVVKREAAELIGAVQGLTGWLAEAGFTAHPAPVAP